MIGIVTVRTSNVRFGSKADICAAITHVRFTPESDRESGHPQELMSALPPKADMCGAIWDVRFGPEADIAIFVTDRRDGLRLRLRSIPNLIRVRQVCAADCL